MSDEQNRYIDLAVKAGFVSPKQADTLRDELSMFPGLNARQVMLRRQMITPMQLTMLDKAQAEGGVPGQSSPAEAAPQGWSSSMSGGPGSQAPPFGQRPPDMEEDHP